MAPTKQSTMWWELVDPQGSVFPLEELEAQEKPLHEVLCLPQGGGNDASLPL